MTTSFLQDLLYSIADQLHKGHETVDPYIRTLEDNWFDSKEALEKISDETFEKLKIPLKLGQMIRENLQKQGRKEENPVKEQENTKENNEQVAYIEKESNKKDNKVEIFFKLSEDLKCMVPFKETLKQTLLLLKTIVSNIIANPNNPTIRRIKLVNKKFSENILPFSPAVEMLKTVGFVFDSECAFLPESFQDLHLLIQLNENLEHELTSLEPAFDPYQSFVTGSNEYQISQELKKKGEESFIDKLEELKKKRDLMMKPIKNREIKIFRADPTKTLRQLQTEMIQSVENAETYDPNKDPELKKALFNVAKNFSESQKFSSKSKKEFEELLEKPFYVETKIRIKLPDSIIWEGKFTPKETLFTVFDLFRNFLIRTDVKDYLFQTPPFKRLTVKDLQKTLEELESVPCGLFHYALEDKKLEGEMKSFLNE